MCYRTPVAAPLSTRYSPSRGRLDVVVNNAGMLMSGVAEAFSTTTAHIVEPFMSIYFASKAAGEAFAESMGFEVTRFGIDSVILVPGAFTQST